MEQQILEKLKKIIEYENKITELSEERSARISDIFVAKPKAPVCGKINREYPPVVSSMKPDYKKWVLQLIIAMLVCSVLEMFFDSIFIMLLLIFVLVMAYYNLFHKRFIRFPKEKKTIYFEYESGMKVDRIQLKRLLNTVKSGDTILATEVSRFTRSTKQLCDIIEFAKERHIKLVLGSFIVDCSKELDPMTEGMLKMMGVFSELERNMISQRVKSGMENARLKGKKIGRPMTTLDTIPNIFYKYYPVYKEGKINKKEFSRLSSLSYPTIYKYIQLVENTVN